MTSSPASTDTQINPSRTTVLPINPPVLVTPITQHTGISSQNPFDINLPHGIIPGTNLPYNAPTHHTDRSIPSVPFHDLTWIPAINTPNLNTVTQTLNLPLSSKEAMIRNIQTQMELMQHWLNTLIQDNNSENKEAMPS